MAEESKPPPGVILWHRGARIFKKADQKNVELTLVAQVNDEELWNTIEKKFIDGFSVYAAEDFKSQILTAVRDEMASLRAKNASLENQLMQKNRENTLLEQKLEEVSAPLRALGERLGR